MQQDGSMLSLLVGEQVCRELVNRWKTRGHGRLLVISGPRDGLTSGVRVPRGTVELARLWTALGGGQPATAPESTARLRSSENMAEY